MATNKAAPLGLLVLFDTVTVLSFFLIGLIVATAYFSKYVRRRKAWYGQMIQWMIYCMSYMLLFGFQKSTNPPKALCLIQASLIYACPPACAVGSTCFMIDFYMSLSPLHRRPSFLRVKWLDTLLVLLPWITLVGATLQVILFTLLSQKLDTVGRSKGYFICNISDPEPTIVSVALVLLALIAWFYFEGVPDFLTSISLLAGSDDAESPVRSGLIMHQNRLEFAKLQYKTSQGYLSLYIRSAIFTIGMIIGTGISIYCIPRRTGMGSWSVALPFMPIFVALVFGTQSDIMRVWLFWKQRTPEEELGYNGQSDGLSSITFDEMLLHHSLPTI